MVDGSNLVMTDVSAEMSHEDRQILVRESRTGILRDADQTERDRRIEMYYPSKHTTIQIPRYIDVDHSQIEQDRMHRHIFRHSLDSLMLAIMKKLSVDSQMKGYGNNNRRTW